MRSTRSRWGWNIGAVVVLVGGVVLANYGAGVTPAGAEGAPPGWDNNFPSAKRFVVLAAFGNEAVLDKNTGLVWEQTVPDVVRPWDSAVQTCLRRNIGGAVGWRLPSVVELKSVQDPSLPAPFVPATVFTGVHLAHHWSASTFSNDPNNAWFVDFTNFDVLHVSNEPKSTSKRAWCVRGPMSESEY